WTRRILLGRWSSISAGSWGMSGGGTGVGDSISGAGMGGIIILRCRLCIRCASRSHALNPKFVWLLNSSGLFLRPTKYCCSRKHMQHSRRPMNFLSGCIAAALMAAMLAEGLHGQTAPARSAATVAEPLNWTAQQDHQNMMEQLGIKRLRPGPSG